MGGFSVSFLFPSAAALLCQHFQLVKLAGGSPAAGWGCWVPLTLPPLSGAPARSPQCGVRAEGRFCCGCSRCCQRGAGLRRVLPSTSQRCRPRGSAAPAAGRGRIPLLLPSLSLFCFFAQKLGLTRRTPARLHSPKTLPPTFLLGRKQYGSNSPKINVLHHAQPAETFT